ncbi:MAG: 30S ribosomal protein S20 [Candidatus Wallbacteria bacterium]|nr:30S ribosomal protein S20 [Candidatus Wallbacteria bacterium]
MKTSKSVKKRIRQSEKRRLRNRQVLSTEKTQVKKFSAAVEEKSGDLQTLLRETLIVVDKTASKGVIHKNKASRTKSRLTKKLNKAVAAKE